MKKLICLPIILLSVVLSLGCTESSTEPNIPDGSDGSFYALELYPPIHIELPCVINIMFQVTDASGEGVSDLTTDDFGIYEDGDAVSPTESFPLIMPREDIPYKIKTVLMLDNSPSIGTDLDAIKTAAKEVVNNITNQQEIAVYKFSEAAELVQDFTSNLSDLISAIDTISLAVAGGTNLNGAVVTGVSCWNDHYGRDSIRQGSLIILTDGSDTQHSVSLDSAISARGNKRVYTMGLGDEIEPDKLDSLGNAGFYPISGVGEVASKFLEIQNSIIAWANSFYWLNYMSPTRVGHHTLNMDIENNSNTGDNSNITGDFNSDGFFPLPEGVYVNLSSSHHNGINSLNVEAFSPVTLTARTIVGDHFPDYSWTTNTDSITIEVDAIDNAIATVTGVGHVGGSAAITVTDIANGFTRTIAIRNVFSMWPLATLDTPGDAWDVFLQGNYAYVADGGSGLQVLDVTNPAVPVSAGSYDTPGTARGIYVQGNYAYVADGGSGLQVIDITNPSVPTLAGSYDTPGTAQGIYVQGDYAYVADGGSGLQVIDITNPSVPTLAGSYDTPDGAYGIYVLGDYAFVTDSGSGLQVIDITNPAVPTLAGSYDTPDYALGIYVQGDYAYVADGSSGLQVIDITNPAVPTLAGSYDTPGSAFGVCVKDYLAYVADRESGLQVIDITNPAVPTLAGSFNTLGRAHGIYVKDDLVYVADGGSGLQILLTNMY